MLSRYSSQRDEFHQAKQILCDTAEYHSALRRGPGTNFLEMKRFSQMPIGKQVLFAFAALCLVLVATGAMFKENARQSRADTQVFYLCDSTINEILYISPGYGLHSGALAARELGGSLTARSDGSNQGAVFTLELPLRPSKQPS